MLDKTHSEETKKSISDSRKKYFESFEAIKKQSEAQKKRFENSENHPMYGKKHSEETKKRMGESRKGSIRNWKGGVTKSNIPLYDTYAPQISYAEQVRRNQDDPNILEVKCTYCGKWFVPQLKNVNSRKNALNGNTSGENRLYCSDQCKRECPIYKKQKFSSEENNQKQYSREVQPELRQIVFERDNWTCQKCRSTESLHCHHIEGIRWEPLESADIDKCITYCKSCHGDVHKIDGCGYQDMRCK